MATMLISLIGIFKLGPDVSLNGSPYGVTHDCSLVDFTAFAAKVAFFHILLALSHAPPAFAMKMASTKPLLNPPISRPSTPGTPKIKSRRNQTMIAISDGITISRCALSSRLPHNAHNQAPFLRKDSLDFAELAAHFVYHMGRCTSLPHSSSIHRKEMPSSGPETYRKNFQIHQRHIVVMHKVKESGILKSHGIAMRKRQFSSPEAGQPDTDFLDIRGQQSQSRQSGGTDGKAFARSGCSIAQGVKRIGTLAHLFTQTGHFRIATRVVGYRSVSICSKRDAQCRNIPTAAMPIP